MMCTLLSIVFLSGPKEFVVDCTPEFSGGTEITLLCPTHDLLHVLTFDLRRVTQEYIGSRLGSSQSSLHSKNLYILVNCLNFSFPILFSVSSNAHRHAHRHTRQFFSVDLICDRAFPTSMLRS